MLPSSNELEEYFDRLEKLDADLTKLKSAEVTDAKLVDRLATAAKEWLRTSQRLRNIGDTVPECVNENETLFRRI